MSRERNDFEEPLGALGQLLAERGLRYELVAIGGGALQLLGLITRPTRDIDVVALVESATLVPVVALPVPLERAVEDTARLLRLPLAWFNTVRGRSWSSAYRTGCSSAHIVATGEA